MSVHTPGQFRQVAPSLTQGEAYTLTEAVQAKHSDWVVTVSLSNQQMDKEGLDFFTSIGIDPEPSYVVRINAHDSGVASYVQTNIRKKVKELAESEEGLGREIPDDALEIVVSKRVDPRGR